MNYQHIYHAGNFADVVKHLSLIAVLQYYKKKPNPMVYIDTHAGQWTYDFAQDEAQRTQEFKEGIQALQAKPHPLLAQYLELVSQVGPGHYPGSVWFAHAVLEATDKCIACEYVPEVAARLKHQTQGFKNIAVHHRNGYEALLALTPPKPNRGVILIDPPFEAKDEFATLHNTIKAATTKFPQGCYIVWYPMKDFKALGYIRTLAQLPIPQLNIECYLTQDTLSEKLRACGIWIGNPPWQLEKTLLPQLQAAMELMAPGSGSVTCQVKTES